MLTDRLIQNKIKECTREIVLNDGAGGRGTGSLRLVIRPSGAVWFGAWYENETLRKKSLGRYPDVPLREARERFRLQVGSALVAGRSPKAAAITGGKPTLEAMFAGYVAGLRLEGKRSADHIEHVLGVAAKQIGSTRLVAEVDAADVSAYLRKMYLRGARTGADRDRSYIHAAFNWALKSTNDYRSAHRREWGITSNPVATIPKDTTATKARDRALSASEIKTLWYAVEGYGFAIETKCAVRMMICCGQRVMETLRAEGSDFDMEAMVWSMPAHKTKNGKPHRLPMPELCRDVLRPVMGLHGQGQLFPARHGSAELMNIGSVQKAIRRWLEGGVQMEYFQARDIRRTWKSRAHDAGVDRYTRDRIQQHAQGDIGSVHYDRSDYMPQMREAMAKWEAWLKDILAH